DDRDGFENEHATDNGEEKFLLPTNRDHPHHAANGERASIAHENFCRVTIAPEEAEAGANKSGANHRYLAGEGIKWYLQIFRDFKVTGGIGEKSVSERDGDGAADGKTVETISQVDGVGGTDNYHGEEN